MALEKVGVRATIEGLASFENGMRRMDKSIETYGKKAMTASERTKILTDSLKKVGIGLTAVAAASGALIFSSVRLAARVETLGVVTTVLGKNVGKTEKEIRDLEKAIQDQGITLRGSRQAIALMIQANIDLSRSTDLARLAQDAAVIAGVNSTEAFERLVAVISTGNVRMARTLGLQVSFAQGMEKMAKETGKTTAELTPLERTQARTNEVLRAGVNIAGAYTAAMGTVGKEVTSLDRLIEDSMVTLGEAWLPVYAGVVSAISDSLKAWLGLSQAQRDTISTTLGLVTFFTGLFGVAALIGSKLPGLIAGFGSLAKALGIVATGALSASAALGIFVVATGAVILAAIAVVKSILDIRAGVKEVEEAFEKHKKEVFKTAKSYEEYRAEMVRSGLEIAKLRLGVDRFNKIMKLGGEEAVLSAAKVEIFTESQLEGGREIQRTTEMMARQKAGLGGMQTAAESAAASAERLRKKQEELREGVELLNKTIDLDITEQFKDYRTKVLELTATITELEKKKYLTKQQKEQLETTREELVKLEAQWDETTAKIIFDLAQQRLAIDGFTKDELAALRKLAGPQGLGLIDAAAVILLESIDELAVGLDEGTVEIGEFTDEVLGLQGPLTDSALDAFTLAFALAGIKSKSVTITTNFVTRTIGGGAAPPRSVAAAVQQAAISPAMLQRLLSRQFGGFLQAGRAAIIGERGPEIFAPRRSGMVLNNRMVGALNQLVVAVKSMPAMMSPGMARSISNVTHSPQFNMNIHTRAQAEPLMADFRTMQSIANAL